MSNKFVAIVVWLHTFFVALNNRDYLTAWPALPLVVSETLEAIDIIFNHYIVSWAMITVLSFAFALYEYLSWLYDYVQNLIAMVIHFKLPNNFRFLTAVFILWVKLSSLGKKTLVQVGKIYLLLHLTY